MAGWRARLMLLPPLLCRLYKMKGRFCHRDNLLSLWAGDNGLPSGTSSESSPVVRVLKTTDTHRTSHIAATHSFKTHPFIQEKILGNEVWFWPGETEASEPPPLSSCVHRPALVFWSLVFSRSGLDSDPCKTLARRSLGSRWSKQAIAAFRSSSAEWCLQMCVCWK